MDLGQLSSEHGRALAEHLVHVLERGADAVRSLVHHDRPRLVTELAQTAPALSRAVGQEAVEHEPVSAETACRKKRRDRRGTGNR